MTRQCSNEIWHCARCPSVYRHQKILETVACLRGRLVWEYYDEQRRCNVPIGQWHIVRALDSGFVILEVKDGAYEPFEEGDVLK